MTFLGPLNDLVQRVATYSPFVVAVELAVIWAVVYVLVRFVQGTRAAGALKGLFFVLVCVFVLSRLVSKVDSFARLAVLYDRFLALVAVALVVIFQPELRRALVRLGETPLFRASPSEIGELVDEIVDACVYCSKARFGALVVIERQVALSGLVEGGTTLDAAVSSRLLQAIFFPGAALHDLAVVIKGKLVRAAGVQLPLADPADMPDPSFGSRHRAAVGLTKECDAICVVVSEESGRVRIAERGKLTEPLTPESLRAELRQRLERSVREADESRQRAAGVGAVDPESEIGHG